MQLHAFDVAHDHGPIGDRDDKPYGNGVLLWFEVDDFDDAAARAAELNARCRACRRHRNPPVSRQGRSEIIGSCGCAIRTVTPAVLASPDGSAGPPSG